MFLFEIAVKKWIWIWILINIGKIFAIYMIRFYRKFISPLKKPSCIYYPTCSSYAIEAIQRFGLIKGGYLSLRRILRCHPFAKGGYDPVPNKEDKK